MKHLKEYKNILVFENEYDDNFLLLFNNRTLSVGYIVTDILLCLQQEVKLTSEIQKKIYDKHKLEISINSIENIITKLDKFIEKGSDSFFIRLFKFANPSKIIIGENFLFKKHLFYPLFFLAIMLNIYLSKSLKYNTITGFGNWFFWLTILMFLLILHEIGHSASSKKHGVLCKELGLGLYLIFPVLYTNLGETWKLQKEKRIIINLSGIYFQLIIGVIIGFIAHIFNSNLLSFIFYSNIAIILFNFNPFIKLDGYWVITDLLNIKNLSKISNNQIASIFLLKFNKLKNSWLIAYSVAKLIFLLLIVYVFFNLVFSIITKIYYSAPLTIRDYLLILIILIYAYKSFRKKDESTI